MQRASRRSQSRRPTRTGSPAPVFRPQFSLLDSETTECDLDARCSDAEMWRNLAPCQPFTKQAFGKQIRGWIHLFWVVVAYFVGIKWYEHYTSTGCLFGLESWTLLHMAYRDWWALLGFSLSLLAYTFLAVPLEWLFSAGVLQPQGRTIWVVRHTFALSVLGWAFLLSQLRDWPRLQVATYLMHATVLFMKVHSYTVNNEELCRAKCARRRSRNSLDDAEYPNNTTLGNYFWYLLAPTLIYQPAYPLTPRVRKSFLLDRTLGLLVILGLIYATIHMHVLPVLQDSDRRDLGDMIVRLLLPITLSVILLFFFVFEYLLNWFAEVTRFADRRFYDDWWNSTDYAEFARKWNRPVHRWLQEHVYFASIHKHGWSKQAAAFWTFLLSSILHELIVSTASGKYRIIFFSCQMMQIPLISLATRFQLSRFPRTANIAFWISTMLGITGLLVIYSGQRTLF